MEITQHKFISFDGFRLYNIRLNVVENYTGICTIANNVVKIGLRGLDDGCIKAAKQQQNDIDVKMVIKNN